MSELIGTEKRPLSIAIIGSGPSGFYAAEALLKNSNIIAEVDMFEYLPTPYGLVRAGVAPDHQQIKAVAKVYDRIAHMDRFRFWGNVQFGKDITREEILDTFDTVIYAIGAQSDRAMGIPGEDLKGSHSATEFVAWYNGHPDYKDHSFDLSQEHVTIIGVGNVALDIARILALTPAEIAKTDIPHHVQEQLQQSKVKEINLIARRGPMQAAFTNTGTRELPHLEGAVAVVDRDELILEEQSEQIIEETQDKRIIQNLDFLNSISNNIPEANKKTIRFLFRRSPQEIIGADSVEAVTIVHNELFADEHGKIHLEMTDVQEEIESGLVFRSIGYRVKPIDGIQADSARGVVSNVEGRVTDVESKEVLDGEYVVGWAKRGASGVIGTNKPDSYATVEKLIEDISGKSAEPEETKQVDKVTALLNSKEIHYVPFEDWKILDEIEVIEGSNREKPREKIVTVSDMLTKIKENKLSV